MTNQPIKIDSFEFWVRFVCGAVLGIFVSFRLVLRWHDGNPVTLILATTGVMLVCGFAAAQFGDKFWS